MDDEYDFELPLCIELKPSKYIPSELGDWLDCLTGFDTSHKKLGFSLFFEGVFTNTTLNADQFLGSYKGKRRDSMSQCIDPEYVWTVCGLCFIADF
jgi:hypothetical protein